MLLPVLQFDTIQANPSDPVTQWILKAFDVLGIDLSLYTLLFVIGGIVAAKGIFLFVQSWIQQHILCNMIRHLRLEFLQQYERMRYSHYTSTETGYFTNLITVEVPSSNQSFSRFTMMLVNFISILIYLGFSFTLNWQLTLICGAMGGGIFGIFAQLSRQIRNISVKYSKSNSDLAIVFIQMIHAFKYLKAVSGFSSIGRHIRNEIHNNRNVHFYRQMLGVVPRATFEPLIFIAMASMILYQVEVLEQPISLALVTLFFLYRCLGQIRALQESYHVFLGSFGAVNMVETAREQLRLHTEAPGKQTTVDFQRALCLEEVSHVYGNQPILQNVSLKIPSNMSIAIIGESGAGKTTVMDLLAGLLMPQAGKVTLDGIDYQELDLDQMRHLFGYITQDPMIFSDTIANNITFWDEGFSTPEGHAKLEQVARMAHCWEFIQQTPDGFNTWVGEKGVKLSGGQKQRLAIARELYRDPPILLFDEATSALDSESERLIQQSIQQMMGKKTLILIAHRLSTIRHCNYIYVLQQGRVVQEGTWDELIQQEDLAFARMCRLQGIL